MIVPGADDALRRDLAAAYRQAIADRCDPGQAAALLLPVVHAVARAFAADQLDAAADGQVCTCDIRDDYGLSCLRHGDVADDLRERAAALRGHTTREDSTR